MVVDGKQIAEEIFGTLRDEVAKRSSAPILTIITCAPNFETQKYLALKEKKAAAVGIETNVVELDTSSRTEDFISAINAHVPTSSGIIVQLPLPPHIDTNAVLHAVPVTHDVDALNPLTRQVLSPVVGAMHAIVTKYGVTVEGKRAVVIGNGKLVGIPATAWLTESGARVDVVTKDTQDIASHTLHADIIVCGAGVPGLLTPSMIHNGVVILDAGTSEEGGVLRGDADPACREKAALITPVPGGIGPITIAILLRNLVELSSI